MLQAQEKLDAVEQKRTKNVYAHSCRKVTMASYALNASSVDTSQCSAEQIKLEQEAEKRQMFDKAFEDSRVKNGRFENQELRPRGRGRPRHINPYMPS